MRRSRLAASRLSEKDREMIAGAYREGATTTALAVLHGFSTNFILRIVKKAGVPIRPMSTRGRISGRGTMDRIVGDYLAGMTCDQIAKKYGYANNSGPWQVLKRRGLTRPSEIANRRYSLDESAFDPPLTDEKLYWMGIIATDGFVSPKKDGATTIGLALSSRDGDHVRALTKFLRTNQPVTIIETPKQYAKSYKSGGQVRLQVRSWRLAESLLRHGIGPRKTATLKVSCELARSAAFWRGAIDGDGSLCIQRVGAEPHKTTCAYLRLCSASLAFIRQFSEFCRFNCPGCKATIGNGNHTYDVRIGGIYAARLITMLYPPRCISMQRKRIKARKIIAMYERRLKSATYATA